MANLLSYFRGGRSWELSGVENRALRGMSLRGIVACALILPIAISFAGLVTMFSVASFAEPLSWHFRADLGTRGVAALRERKALQAHEFLKLNERLPQIDDALWKRMRRVAMMSELKGMGLEKALLLEKLRINTFEELARQQPADLSEKLRQIDKTVRARDEEVKVWIRAARRRMNQQWKNPKARDEGKSTDRKQISHLDGKAGQKFAG